MKITHPFSLYSTNDMTASTPDRLYHRPWIRNIYNRLLRKFYLSLHHRSEIGIQLNLTGFGCSNIDSIYNGVFLDSIALADYLITSKKFRLEEVFEAFKLFYQSDEFGKFCDTNDSLKDSFAFATVILDYQRKRQSSSNELLSLV